MPKAQGNLSLTALALVRKMPEQLVLKDLSLDYMGALPSSNVFTAAYGATSGQLLLETASDWSRANQPRHPGSMALMVDLAYSVENFSLTRSQGNEEQVLETGWLHMDRLQASYRKELREKWIAWIAAEFGAQRAESLEASGRQHNLADLALEYPQYIHKLMRSMRHLRAIVHPVRLGIDTRVVLWVCSFKYDRTRIADVNVRFLRNVTVKV